jgi:hypothetical protein
MAKAKAKAPATDDKRVIVEIDGSPRMLLNEAGMVTVVQRTISTPFFPGNVRGLRPEAAAVALRLGEVELHASSVVDVDPEDDTSAPSPASPAPSSDA